MPTEKFGIKIFAVIVTAILILLSGYMLPSLIAKYNVNSANKGGPVPTNASIAIVPVEVSNTQTVPTTDPFNLKVVVDSSLYSQYESPHLQNVYWKTINNTLIPSWIQSGNNRNSTNTTYWLKLPFSIGPRSNATIYLAFDNLNVSLFSSTGYEGEFASATQNYGKYDNGAKVFEFYDNFAGNSLNYNNWNVVYNNSGASYSVNNGLSVTGAYNNGYVSVVTKQKYSGIYEAYLEYTGTNSWGGSGIFLGINSPVSSGGYYGFHEGYSFFVTDNRPGSGYGSYIVIIDNGSAHNIMQTPNQYTYNSLMKISWSSQELSWDANGNPLLTTNNSVYPTQPVYFDLWVGGDLTNSETANYQYARILTNEPNGIMPSATFGNLNVTMSMK